MFNKYAYREDYNIVSDWIAWIEWILKNDCSFLQIDVKVAVQDMTGISNTQSLKLKLERDRALKELFGERIAIELPQLYNDNDKLKGELNIPAVNMLLYLYHKAPRIFSHLYRIISAFVKLIDRFKHEDDYKDFTNKDYKV